MNDSDQLPTLGIGLGFRPEFRGDLFLNRRNVDFLEITADHYLDATPAKLAELDLLQTHFPLIPHGLNLSLGSAEGVDPFYLEKIAALVERVQPAWWSEHICFTRAGGVDIGHLAGLPFTREAIDVLVKNINRVRGTIKTPLILENITYNVNLPGAEFTEAEFVRRVLEETDCGLLLDITNLYINSKNHDYDYREYLDQLPAERIVQLHFVGVHQHGERLIDGHSDAVQDEIWDVFREVRARADFKGAILERDDNFPPFNEMIVELETARRLFKT